MLIGQNLLTFILLGTIEKVYASNGNGGRLWVLTGYGDRVRAS